LADWPRHLLLFCAAALAGGINAVAGGGTLISFPAALAWGLPSTIANATNTVAMAPGAFASAWAYRRELRADLGLTLRLAAPSVVGAVAGAAILRHSSQRLFDLVVPWLVLGATLLILLQNAMPGGAPAAAVPPPVASRRRLTGVMLCQFAVGVYGGYFGAAIGIVMLAALSVVVPGDIQRRIGVKNLLGALINGVAAVYFVVAGLVDRRAAPVMIAGAIAGGLVGGRLARRASPRIVRAVVVAIGLGLSALLAYRNYLRA
jgi:uncharacterized membrane protein YfcA